MKKLHSNYPFGQLIIAVFNHSGLKLPDFIRAIGYGNIQKGIRSFQEILATGIGPSIFFHRLQASPFAVPNEALAEIARQNFQQIDHELEVKYQIEQEEKERTFVPIAHAIPNIEEFNSITLFAITGGFSDYTISLPHSIATWRPAAQHRYVGARIRENYARNAERITLFGPIKHYLYFARWNEPPTAFTIQGEMIGIAEGASLPKFELRVGKRKVCERLINRMLLSSDTELMH